MSSKILFFSGVGAAVILSGVGVGLFLSNDRGADSQEADMFEGDGEGLYITTMTHMEGSFKDDTDEDLFLRHVDQIRWAMDLFDEYGARLTIESEQSFARANTMWNVNILNEVVERGHGVGTHADFGASVRDSSMTVAQMTQRFVENKELVDALIGEENNRGVSGGTGYPDWVTAAANAGFVYMDGVTGFGYLSMPMSARPDGWTDEYIRSTVYHDSIPPEFSERIYPLPLVDAQDLEADEDSVIVVMGGDIGELASLSEGRSNCFPDCVLDEDDVWVIREAIEEAGKLREEGKFARINMHIPLELLKEENEEILRAFLEMVQEFVEQGVIAWETQVGSYDAFVSSGGLR